jgi:hypothetical protein
LMLKMNLLLPPLHSKYGGGWGSGETGTPRCDKNPFI